MRVYFDQQLMKDYAREFNMQQLTLERVFPKPYRSTWRVLHVDGFEGCRAIRFEPMKRLEFYKVADANN